MRVIAFLLAGLATAAIAPAMAQTTSPDQAPPPIPFPLPGLAPHEPFDLPGTETLRDNGIGQNGVGKGDGIEPDGEAEAAAPAPPPDPAAELDALFTDLASAEEEGTAKVAEQQILQRLLRSGSDTTDLLMARAIKSINEEDYPLALDLLDQVILLEPDYAEGWNKRATVFFLQDEFGKALADIERTLTLESRHFGALSGLGMIMRELEEGDRAIEAFRAALAVHPFLENVREALEETESELGQDI